MRTLVITNVWGTKRYILRGGNGYPWCWESHANADDYIGVFHSRREALEWGRKNGLVV